MKTYTLPRILTATITLGILAASAPHAWAKHHSNTFSKIGHAIQYTARKDSTNVSKVTHRAIGHNSVVRRNHGHHHYNRVLTSQGHVRRIQKH
jgi:hypothetical protein